MSASFFGIVTDKPGKAVEGTISVVVPTYNRPDDIVGCLQALESQTRLPDQVIVTVRADDTRTLERLTEFKEQTALPLDIALVTEPGVMKALNRGLKELKGDIVCFTDDDARPHPDWLERIARHYRDPRVGGVGGRDLIHNSDGTMEGGQVDRVGKMNWFGRRYSNHHMELKSGQPVDVFTLKGVNSSYRSRLTRDFDEYLLGVTQVAWEDDLGLDIVGKGYKLVYDPKVLVDHFPSAKRPEGRGPRINFDRTHIYNVNHNYTYVLLKHLAFWRKISFLLYSFLIGDTPSYGLVRVLYTIVETKKLDYLPLLWVSYQGKIRGIGTYLRYKRKK